MNNTLIIIIGWLIGQVLYACKKSWDIQKKTVSLDFKAALGMHFRKETASFAFATALLAAAIFILPDFINLDITKEELKNTEAAKWKLYLISFLRVISLFFGYLCQNIGYFIFGRSEKIIQKQASNQGIDLNL